MSRFSPRVYFPCFAILALSWCAMAQPVVTFTSPDLGKSFPFGEAVTGTFTVTSGGGTIEKVELVINHGEPEIVEGPDYNFSYSDLAAGYYLIEVSVFTADTTVTVGHSLVVKPEPWPALPPAPATDGKLKVFIMAGQSNTQGHGQISNSDPAKLGTLDYYLETEPENYGHLVDNNGDPLARDDVWITTTDGDKQGWLNTGFGVTNDKIGPELAFGHVMGDFYQDPVLLLKTAWGGKSLGVDFRPPGADGTTGEFYTQMIDRINLVLGDISTYFPEYADGGYDIAGLAWHQGWNDRGDVAMVDEYESLLEQLIKDVRTDLNTADMPFVVGISGFSGYDLWDKNEGQEYRLTGLQNAQFAVADPAKYPDFEGNVEAVDTRAFWREPDIAPSSQSYHWNQNFESYYLVGESMGHAMAALIGGPPVNIEKNFTGLAGNPVFFETGQAVTVAVDFAGPHTVQLRKVNGGRIRQLTGSGRREYQLVKREIPVGLYIISVSGIDWEFRRSLVVY